MAEFALVTFDGLNPPVSPLSPGDLLLISQNGVRGDILTLGAMVAYLNTTLAKPTLGALANVNTSGVTDGQYLKYDTTTGKWIPHTLTFPPIPSELTNLADVVVGTPTGNQFLRYDETTGKWINVTVTIPTALTGLNDLSITAPVDKQLLRYNATAAKWENYTPIQHYDVGIYSRTTPETDTIFAEYMLTEALTYLTAFAGSMASVGVAPVESDAVITIRLDGAALGTLTVAQTTGTTTFALTTDTAIPTGSVIGFTTAYAGTGLERLRITLRGRR